MKRTILLTITILAAAIAASSQIQFGTIRGVVMDQSDALIPNAEVRIEDPITGFQASARTNDEGEFRFNNLYYGVYSLRANAGGFSPWSTTAEVRSNVIVRRDIRLNVGPAIARVDVETLPDVLVDPQQTSTVTRLGELQIEHTPGVIRSQDLHRLIGTAGVTAQNNGLLHVRGSEDGILYVVDGVPTRDRIDSISAGGFDLDSIRSLQLITGGFPAEFGGRSGAVAVIQANSGINSNFAGRFTAGAGNHRTQDASGSIAYGWGDRFGIFASAAANRSDRFLDPVVEDNLNNRGRRRSLSLRADWHPTPRDLIFFDLRVSGSDMRVTNDRLQEEAGQRQTQRLRNDAESVSWQRIWNPDTVTNLIFFRRNYTGELFPSPFDIPITAQQDRGHWRTGLIGSYSRSYRGHDIKFGFEASRVSVREDFSFAITDLDIAEEMEISDAAQEFTPDKPFIFRDAKRGSYGALYAQTRFEAFRNLSLGLGLRFDRSKLLSAETQLSPRIAAAYFIPRTQTVLRASFNRLFQPPQLENLLLSDSPQARALSPFLDETDGGARVSAERVSAYEIGLTQNLWNAARLDVSLWRRNFVNYADPNAFFSTTIVFPNTVKEGYAHGADVRLDIAEYRGFSGYASFANGTIHQIGPIIGGLFLTDEFIEIGEGTRFVPDHDQRNVFAFAVTYRAPRSGWFMTFGGRHESGVPLEVEDDRLIDLMNTPGSDLVNFDRERVRPWTVFDLQTGWRFARSDRRSLRLEMNVLNIFDTRFAYNFGSPFEGTHFGHRRLIGGRLTVDFR